MEIVVLLIVVIVVSGGVSLLSSSYGKTKYGEEEWNRQMEKEEYGKGYGIECPNCGKVNVKKISTASSAVSVGTVGLASDKIGKTFKCPKCGYTW